MGNRAIVSQIRLANLGQVNFVLLDQQGYLGPIVKVDQLYGLI